MTGLPHPSPGPDDDRVLPFTVEQLDIRGRVVRLGVALDTIVSRHGYPEVVARVLGEAVALTSLLGTSLKLRGRFQLQTKADGPIRMLVVDFDSPDRLRAVARIDEPDLAAAIAEGRTSTGQLLGKGHLAMTIDQGTQASRYQGLVVLDGEQGLEEAGHRYFRQSEQIPTRLRLATARIVGHDGDSWRAGGIMVQFLPTSPERQKQQDLDPGDDPSGRSKAERDVDGVVDDAWMEARSLVDTAEDHELVDPTLSSEDLLYRLFNERDPRVFEPQPVREQCRCSRDSVLSMLRRFPAQDRRDMTADDGAIEVTCEFCSTTYRFIPAEVDEAQQQQQ